MRRDRLKTPASFASRKWGSIKQRLQRDKCYANILLGIEREAFDLWILDNWPLIKEIKSLNQIPSVDRIDPRKGYYIANLRIISFAENTRLGQLNANTPIARQKRNDTITAQKQAQYGVNTCTACGIKFLKRTKESWNNYGTRKTCSKVCKHKQIQIRKRELKHHG